MGRIQRGPGDLLDLGQRLVRLVRTFVHCKDKTSPDVEIPSPNLDEIEPNCEPALTLGPENVGLEALHDLGGQDLLGHVPVGADHVLDNHDTPQHDLKVRVGQDVQEALHPLGALEQKIRNPREITAGHIQSVEAGRGAGHLDDLAYVKNFFADLLRLGGQHGQGSGGGFDHLLVAVVAAEEDAVFDLINHDQSSQSIIIFYIFTYQ